MSQTHPNSPVFKDYKASDSTSIFKRVSDSYYLWQSYYLTKEANEGNALAMHELGIRYLTGKGFPIDTVKSVYWIQKAAELNLTAAKYNMGIFLNNGWGIKWDPFKAYRYFCSAAADSMVEALYVVGLLYTDNIIVQRDLSKAYKYEKAASAKGYKPAKEVLVEFIKNGIGIGLDSTINTQAKPKSDDSTSVRLADPLWGIGMINFAGDSTSKSDEATLLKELLINANDELKNAFGNGTYTEKTFKDTSALKIISKAAEAGSPEAMVLLGKCYEKGITVSRDKVLAAMEYIRAVRLDSQRGGRLLWSLLQDSKFFPELKSRVDKKEANARFVIAGLTAIGYNYQVSDADALKYLQEAASSGHIAAMNELGLCYYTGNLVKENKQKAIETWQKAASLGSSEAQVRISIANIQSKLNVQPVEQSFGIILKSADEGALLAQMALAKCYETGMGVIRNKSKALHYYRLCAQRGSRGAYNALKNIYDEIRPKDEEFKIHQED